MDGTEEIPRRRIRWKPCYRAIPSRFPPVDLFERIADPADLDAVIALESLTNERLRDATGEISLVAAGDRVVGPGAGYVMAAFTHPSPTGGRFTAPGTGAWYAARRLETALAETRHHRETFMRATAQRPMELDMRVLEADVDARLHDLRGRGGSLPSVHDPDDYTVSQALGTRLRAAGSDGLVWDSVRHAGGQCMAVFRPTRIRNCRSTRHVTFVWDGERVSHTYEKRALSGFPPGAEATDGIGDGVGDGVASGTADA